MADVVSVKGDQLEFMSVSNPQMHWQKRSLHALRCFAVEPIAVTRS